MFRDILKGNDVLMDNQLFYGLMGLVGFAFIVGLLGLGAAILLYALESRGLQVIANRQQLQYPWLAWIPFARDFTFGAIVDDLESKSGKNTYYKFIMLGGGILASMISGGPHLKTLSRWAQEPYNIRAFFAAMIGASFLSNMITVGFYVLGIFVFYKVIKAYRPDSAVLYTALSAIPFLNFLKPIFLFSVRNHISTSRSNDY